MPVQILVVEDEAPIRELIEITFRGTGYQISSADSGEQALDLLNEQVPDLVLLDWMLPGMSGIEFARRLRRHPLCNEVPVIMLTARGEEDDKIRGLDSGADDFVTKPFSPRELISRVKAVLRRTAPTSGEEAVEAQGLKLDPVSHRVSAGAQAIDLGPTEFRLLHFFMTHPERVFSRRQLLDKVWGTNVYVEERTVDVHVRRLRQALTPTGHERLIQTVRGAGYRFSPRL